MDYTPIEARLGKAKAAILKTNVERLTASNIKKDKLAVTAHLQGRQTAQLAGTTTTETGAWIPADVYAQTVFMGLHAERVLGSLAAAVSIDITKGTGDTVQIRVFPKRTAQGPIAEGVALVETALGSLTTKSITIQAYGDYDTLTGQAIDFTSDDVRGRLLAEMGAAVGEKLEQVTYDVLKNAAAGNNTALDVAGVIDYQEVLKANAELKKDKMRGDFLIVGPDHEVDLLLDANLTKAVDYSGGEVSLPGEIGRIGSVRILVHSLANAKSAVAAAKNGIMIDSSRAFGEAFGMPLSFEEERVPESNKWKEVAWVFYGASAIDLDAICHLKNA